MSTLADLTDAVTQLSNEVSAVGSSVAELVTAVSNASISPEDQAAIDAAVSNVQTATSALTADVAEATARHSCPCTGGASSQLGCSSAKGKFGGSLISSSARWCDSPSWHEWGVSDIVVLVVAPSTAVGMQNLDSQSEQLAIILGVS